MEGNNMGKGLLFKTLRHEITQRAPWVPFAGIHAGKLKGYNAFELLTDEDKLVESLLEVNKLYRPDGQPVLFDLQVEAEILGCDLFWALDTPPSVSSHPLSQNPTVPCKCKIPTVESGRLPMILSAMRRMKKEVGNTTALYGLVCGPFTLASHLRGTAIFTDMFDNPDFTIKLIEYCALVGKTVAKMYIEAGMDVIAVVDPLVSQISPRHFKKFMADTFLDIFTDIKQQGVFSSFFVCGDATKNIRVMCETLPDSISVDENINIYEAKNITDEFNIVLGGNIPLTTVMLHGSQQDNMKFAVDMIEKMNANRNFIVAPGCDMPYDTPIENVIGVSQAVLEFEATKKMVENYTSTDFSTIHVDLPNYDQLERPFIEAFTLDSDSCAACTYMWGLVTDVKNRLQDQVDIIEYKFTKKENIARCIKMGVQNLPSLYINGKLRYSSIIPTADELEAEVRKLLHE